MRKERILLILGIWIAVLPYLGFPSFWKHILFSISGMILIYHSYQMYREHKAQDKKAKVFDNFSENI